MADNSQSPYMFSRPEDGFDKDDPAAKQLIQDFYDPINRPRHTLDPRGERSAPLGTRIQEKLDEFERSIKRKPSKEEADRIIETMKKCSGWLEGLKIDAAGKTELPIAFFNRLAQEYAGTIEWVVRDRVNFDAKYIKMVLERDDKIKELEGLLKSTDPELQEKIEDLNKQIATEQQTNKELQNDTQLLQAEIANLQQNATLKGENDDFRKSKLTLSDQVLQCETQKGDVESRLSDEKAANNALRDKIDAMKTERETWQKNIRNSMEKQDDEIEALRKERDNLLQRLNDLLGKEEDLTKKLQDCENRGRRLQAELDIEMMTGSGDEDDGGGPNGGQDDLQRQIDELTQQIGNLTLQNDNLSSSLLAAQANAARLQQYAATVSTEFSDVRQQLNDLQQNHVDVIRQNMDLEAQRDSLQTQLPAEGNYSAISVTPLRSNNEQEAARRVGRTRTVRAMLERALKRCTEVRHCIEESLVPLNR